jgi:uncharacterized membrane protein
MLIDREKSRVARQNMLSRLVQTFLQGVLVLAPVGVTIWMILVLFNAVDNLLPSILHSILPSFVGIDSEGNLKKIPGLGFVVVLLFVLIMGWVSSTFVFGKVLSFVDRVL